MTDPINRIEWLHWSQLCANDYNPNVVMTPELQLLRRSILKTGWVQPVLVLQSDLRIVDGFHRWCLTRDGKLREDGGLPVARLDLERWEAILVTVRMNRAKGSHQALKMHELVTELVDVHGLDEQQVALELGMGADEVRLLYQTSVYKARKLDRAPYSRAWVPVER